MLPLAFSHSPSRSKLSVCRLKEENVVYPPHTPTMKNNRKPGEPSRPAEPANAAKNPITNEPDTLTTRVPQGNACVTRDSMRLESQKRPTLPSAPPEATQRYAIQFCIRTCRVGFSGFEEKGDPGSKKADAMAGLLRFGGLVRNYFFRRTTIESAPRTTNAAVVGSGTANGAKVATLTELELMIAAKLF